MRDEREGLQGRTNYKTAQVSFKGIPLQYYLHFGTPPEGIPPQHFKRCLPPHFHNFFASLLESFPVHQASFLM